MGAELAHKRHTDRAAGWETYSAVLPNESNCVVGKLDALFFDKALDLSIMLLVYAHLKSAANGTKVPKSAIDRCSLNI